MKTNIIVKDSPEWFDLIELEVKKIEALEKLELEDLKK